MYTCSACRAVSETVQAAQLALTWVDGRRPCPSKPPPRVSHHGESVAFVVSCGVRVISGGPPVPVGTEPVASAWGGSAGEYREYRDDELDVVAPSAAILTRRRPFPVGWMSLVPGSDPPAPPTFPLGGGEPTPHP
jgi:hypothetical protein